MAKAKLKFKDENDRFVPVVQDVKVNGTSVFDGEEASINLKTINNQSIVGEGNIQIDSGSSDYEDLENKPSLNNVELIGNKSLSDLGIPTALSDLTDDNTHRTVTDTEKTTWNNKSDVGKIDTGGGEIFNVYSGADKNRASGNCSHAEGSKTTASGDYSHASGRNTTASSLCQTVIGKCNIEDNNNKYMFIAGNGEENLSEGWIIRGNGCTMDWDGNVWVQGNIRTGGTSWDSGSPLIGGVGQNYPGGGEIFNEYTLNKASGANSHAERR